MIAPACYLVDGPLMSAAARRDAVKARMIEALLAAGITTREPARRLLYAQDFPAFDIELLLDEAVAAAVTGQRASAADVERLRLSDLDNQLAAIAQALREPDHA